MYSVSQKNPPSRPAVGATKNAGVENAGVGSMGGKCRSSLAVDGQLNLECKERQR